MHASHEALTLAHEVRVFKAAWCGEQEGELGADFTSIDLRRMGFVLSIEMGGDVKTNQ